MICLRHESCRRAIFNDIADWPTATNPRYFVLVYLGVLWYAVGIPLLLIGYLALCIWGAGDG